MLKRFLLFIFCFSFTIIFIFPSTGLADVCNSVFWSTATSVDIKALSREDLEINECHQFVLLDVIRTKTPLNIALLNSQDSSVVGTYIERLWAIGQSFDLLDSNIEHLFNRGCYN